MDDLVLIGTTISIGVPPRRIDILNWLSGLDWDEATHDAVDGQLGEVPVKFLSLRARQLNKASAGRIHDREDLEKFE